MKIQRKKLLMQLLKQHRDDIKLKIQQSNELVKTVGKVIVNAPQQISSSNSERDLQQARLNVEFKLNVDSKYQLSDKYLQQLRNVLKHRRSDQYKEQQQIASHLSSYIIQFKDIVEKQIEQFNKRLDLVIKKNIQSFKPLYK